MSTLTVDRGADHDGIEGDDEGRMPRRPRRRLLTPWSALLAAAVMCAIGFYVGVRVEKGHIASSPTTIGAGAGGGFAAPGGALTGGAPSGGAPSGGAPTSGAPSGGAAASFASRFGGGNATLGTVASIDGKTLTLTEASGNTVKVKLTSATKITKNESARRRQIHPGDTITVSGLTGKQGTVSAATVTDSGAKTTAGASGSGGRSGSGGSSVSSLFAGG